MIADDRYILDPHHATAVQHAQPDRTIAQNHDRIRPRRSDAHKGAVGLLQRNHQRRDLRADPRIHFLLRHATTDHIFRQPVSCSSCIVQDYAVFTEAAPAARIACIRRKARSNDLIPGLKAADLFSDSDHMPSRLMAKHQRVFCRFRQLAAQNLHVRAVADHAAVDPDQRLIWADLRHRDIVNQLHCMIGSYN